MILNNWAFVTTGGPYDAPEMFVSRLNGDVTGHPNFPDGHNVTTSRVMGKRGELVVTRSGSLYELGTVLPEYERQVPNARERLFKVLPEIEEPKP